MEGLSTQGSKLSETMQNMKPSVPDAVPSSSRGGHYNSVITSNTELPGVCNLEFLTYCIVSPLIWMLRAWDS